jgi:AbiV family abortive infection protein
VRSIALAILGAEEFAKSIAFTVVVFRPDERDTLSKALKKSSGGFYQHKVKHLATHIIDGILIETDQGIEVMESESGSPMSPWERFEERFFQLAVDGLNELVRSKDKAENHAKELKKITRCPPAGAEKQILSQWEGIDFESEQSELKDRALYVGIDAQGDIIVPSQLGDHQAQGEITGLRHFLEEFALLAEALHDDNQWQQLTHSIQSWLAARKQPPS